jgi:hypothetical protein
VPKYWNSLGSFIPSRVGYRYFDGQGYTALIIIRELFNLLVPYRQLAMLRRLSANVGRQQGAACSFAWLQDFACGR